MSNKIEYLEYISDKDIEPCYEKVKVIRELSAPTSIRELQRIIFMIPYYGIFSPNLANTIQLMLNVDDPQDNAIKNSRNINTKTDTFFL